MDAFKLFGSSSDNNGIMTCSFRNQKKEEKKKKKRKVERIRMRTIRNQSQSKLFHI